MQLSIGVLEGDDMGHEIVPEAVAAVLATSPGGLVQMGALTSEMEANTALVVGFHLLRIVTVLLSVPLISRLAAR
jgi:uncharacterized membrane protein AbrB (regulator of aidB expression)